MNSLEDEIRVLRSELEVQAAKATVVTSRNAVAAGGSHDNVTIAVRNVTIVESKSANATTTAVGSEHSEHSAHAAPHVSVQKPVILFCFQSQN